MPLSQNLQLLAGIAIASWFGLIVIALVRLRHIPIEVRQNEIPKMMILASSCAGAVTLGITVLSAIFFPQFLQDNSAAIYTAGFLGSAILIWWTIAVFWRETKLISAQVPMPSKNVVRTPERMRPKPTDVYVGDTVKREQVVSQIGKAILKALRNRPLTQSEIRAAVQKDFGISTPTFLNILTTCVVQGLVMKTVDKNEYRYELTSIGKSLTD